MPRLVATNEVLRDIAFLAQVETLRHELVTASDNLREAVLAFVASSQNVLVVVAAGATDTRMKLFQA